MYTTKQQMSSMSRAGRKKKKKTAERQRIGMKPVLPWRSFSRPGLQILNEDVVQTEGGWQSYTFHLIIKTLYELSLALLCADFSLSFLDFSRCHKRVFSEFPFSLTFPLSYFFPLMPLPIH